MKKHHCLSPSLRSPTLWAAILALSRLSSAQADYPALIQSSHPVAYYRLEEAAGAGTAIDSSDSHLDATISYSSDSGFPLLGQPGIDVSSFTFKRESASFVNIPYDPLLSPTGADGLHGAAFSAECWVQPSTQPGDYSVPLAMFGKYGTGAFGNASGWNFYQTPGPASSWNFNMKNGAFLSSGVTIQLLKWYHLAATFDGGTLVFYVDGVAVSQSAGITTYVANPGDFGQIGAGDNTGFLPFSGGVDEVAFYTNVLSAADILAHYQLGTNSFVAPPTPPSFVLEPSSQTNYAGTTTKLSVVVAGTPPLTYAWQRDGHAIPDATNSDYSFTTTFPQDDGAAFSVIVSNLLGSKTSDIAIIGVLTNIDISGPPFSITRSVGSHAAFRVGAGGAVPLTYQWSRNGTPIAKETNATLKLPHVQLTNDADSYSVLVTNPFLSTNMAATLAVTARSVNVPLTDTYGQLVAAYNPVAYYRLNDDASGGVVDAVGSFDGAFADTGTFTYQTAPGIPGATDTAMGISDGAIVTIPYALELNPDGDWSDEIWFNPASLGTDSSDYRVILSSEYNLFPNPYHGFYIYQVPNGTIAFVPQPGNQFIIGGPNDPANANTLVPGKWYHLVVTKTADAFTVYINGEARASFPVPGSGFIQNGINGDKAVEGGDTVIGRRTDGAFNAFSGVVDEVAIYDYALSPEQISVHYLNTPQLSHIPVSGGFRLRWPAGTLQSATSVEGPYADVTTGIASDTGGNSSYYVRTDFLAEGPRAYYRVVLKP